jgi:hypothetical protein
MFANPRSVRFNNYFGINSLDFNCMSLGRSMLHNILAYLPHARTVGSRKPQNTHAIMSVYIVLLSDGQRANELSGSHVTCPQHDIPDATIGTT